MKKLISLLGVVSISASSLSFVVSCQKDNRQFDNSNDQKNIQQLLTQYSKALYLNENEIDTTSDGLGKIHYSSSYVMSDHVKNNYLSSLGLNDFDGVEINDYSRYSDIAQKYFKNSTDIIDQNTQVDDSVYKGEVISLESPSGIMGTIMSLVQSLPTIMGALSNPAALAPLLAVLSKKLDTLVSPSLIHQLGNILSADVLKDLEKAFSFDAYKDENGNVFSYEDALNSSIIALSNSLDKIVNKDSDKAALANNNKENINNNIKDAAKLIGSNISGIFKKTKSLSLDILTDAKYIPGVLYFLRTLLVYLNSFKLKTLTNDKLSIVDIDKQRTATIKQEDNVLDLKNIVDVLSTLTEDTDGNGGTVLKNLIGAILATPGDKTPDDAKALGLNTPYTGEKHGLMTVITGLLSEMLGGENLQAGPATINVDSFLRIFINWGFGYNSSDAASLIGALYSFKDSLPDMLKSFLTNIGEADWKANFGEKGKFINYLYSSDKALGASVKKLLQNPIGDILKLPLLSSLLGGSADAEKKFDDKKDVTFGFLLSTSVQKIVADLKSNLDKVKDESKYVINFDLFGKLFKSLYIDDLFKKATEDIPNMMHILGLSDDNKSFKDGSPLAILQTIITNYIGVLSDLVNEITGLMNEYNKKLAKTKVVANSVFDSLEVNVESSLTNDFTYKINDKKTNVTNTFEIKLAYEGKYLVVRNIKKVA
ncbi:hypothetical protein SHELI_v1c00460 [Spiroplasma helicoides]|uniref:MOLPALP family lipoprotein n=1 Tax=Spiroplasma helicoides TaxID=216938 RepID=A0A1B3SJ91_9MOLU|nr:MOLPALP family lipoprotein [Spiroplasma helicoides]AOG60001.1 hypothetical protein SHELI_v1c00460 [Spiroplasma helicoides]